MRKSNFALRLQPSLLEEARKLAEAEELAIEALRCAILPGFTRIDQCGCNALVDDPLQQGAGDKLWPIVRAQIKWCASFGHQTR